MKKYIKGSQQTRWPSWPHARLDLLKTKFRELQKICKRCTEDDE